MAQQVPRTFIRCVQWPHPGFDRSAEIAQNTPGWRHRSLDSSHIAYITSPNELASILLELADTSSTSPAAGPTA